MMKHQLKGFFFIVISFLMVMHSSLESLTPKALIFDCDGILIDSEEAKFQAWKHEAQKYNINFMLADYLPVVGNTSEYIRSAIEQKYNITLGPRFIENKNTFYRSLQTQGLPIFEKAVSFAKEISSLKTKENFKMALASSAPRYEIMHNIHFLGLDGIFDVVLSGQDDLGTYKDPQGTNKPKPYIYQEAARLLEVSPDKCLVFEDTNAGIVAAFEAGMIPIAVSNSFTRSHDFSKAYKIYSSFQEFSMQDIFALFVH